jgi:putative transcriptional regulator
MPDQKEKEKSAYLTGQLLLAMPSLGDFRFHKAVIFICAHDENGAMGLVINHTLPGIEMSDLLEQLNIDLKNQNSSNDKIPVMKGGPVESSRGFILHTNDFQQDDTIKVNNKYSVTGTIDALKAVNEGNGPKEMRFILGYSGWSPGQLDEEIQQNAWLIADADYDVLFETNPEEAWEKAINRLGIDPTQLSNEAGRA